MPQKLEAWDYIPKPLCCNYGSMYYFLLFQYSYCQLANTSGMGELSARASMSLFIHHMWVVLKICCS